MTKMAERIRQAREDAGLTQNQVAAALKVKPQAVQQWEAGETSPRPARVEALAKVLKISPEWLAFGTGPLLRSPNAAYDVKLTDQDREILAAMHCDPALEDAIAALLRLRRKPPKGGPK